MGGSNSADDGGGKVSGVPAAGEAPAGEEIGASQGQDKAKRNASTDHQSAAAPQSSKGMIYKY